ncbi:hypothetical protein [Lactococcus garvieae]|uniref:hypothetical protein n=1 Tax=Lactococcus garvieae TaxID=1363 RepID=UPI00035EE7B8|nr:hypothetical protein [Lactococcus garvieae]
MLHNLVIKDRGIFLDEQEIKGITDFKLEKSAKEQSSTLIIELEVNSIIDQNERGLLAISAPKQKGRSDD